jgi:fengycin family lipopeptide synthetase D
MYASVLSILKAGGCWVPLDVGFPRERIRHLINSLRPRVVIVESAWQSAIVSLRQEGNASFNVLVVGGECSAERAWAVGETAIDGQPSDRPTIMDLTPDDLAYIVFTSGSTGAPKGVMVRHRNTTHFLSLCPEFFQIAEGARFAHCSDLTFDPSVFDLFHCWQAGGTLVPFNRRSHRINPGRFLKERRINVLFTVPSVLASIRKSGALGDPDLHSVQHLLLTGEAVPPQLVRDWYDAHPDSLVYNMYGTTECAIVSHWCRLPPDLPPTGPVPVGRPLPGMRVMLLDGNRIVREGEVGEAVVCGPQISSGYWANPSVTGLAFQSDPFEPELPIMVYRTGDLLRAMPDGLHYYVGRRDNQVKVRGHRVELGEIENVLLGHELVHDAAVVHRRREGFNDCLVAFVKADPRAEANQLMKYLAERLPVHMCPSHIALLSSDIPRNTNGKVDRLILMDLANHGHLDRSHARAC